MTRNRTPSSQQANLNLNPNLNSDTTPRSPVAVYLVRHGATAANLEHPPKLQGRHSDLPLTLQGQQQADAASAQLAAVPLVAVYCSPLRRARETAQRIARLHRLDVQVCEELIECDVGRWEGLDRQTIDRLDPAAHRAFLADPATHGYPGGESFAQVQARLRAWRSAVLPSHAGQAVAVVSHHVVLRIWLAELAGLPLSQARQMTIANGEVRLVSGQVGSVSGQVGSVGR